MSIQKRIVHGHNVIELSHLSPVRPHVAGRRCHYCGGPVNRYQEASFCCRCEDAGLEPPVEIELPTVEEPVVIDPFRCDMAADEIRAACAQWFGSMGKAAEFLGLTPGNIYNYTSKKGRARWRRLPQHHVDRMNAYVRGEVK